MKLASAFEALIHLQAQFYSNIWELILSIKPSFRNHSFSKKLQSELTYNYNITYPLYSCQWAGKWFEVYEFAKSRSHISVGSLNIRVRVLYNTNLFLLNHYSERLRNICVGNLTFLAILRSSIHGTVSRKIKALSTKTIWGEEGRKPSIYLRPLSLTRSEIELVAFNNLVSASLRVISHLQSAGETDYC